MSWANPKRRMIMQRSYARRQLLQTLYQWQICADDPEIVEASQILNPAADDLDKQYFDQAWAYITTHREQLDTLAAPYTNRAVTQLDPIEHAILWIGLFELKQRKDIHPTVAINESVELAKHFGSDEGYKFINSLLDKFHKSSTKHQVTGNNQAE